MSTPTADTPPPVPHPLAPGRGLLARLTSAVHEIGQVDKKDFPTNKVYGKTDRPELRPITRGSPSGAVTGQWRTHQPRGAV